jgi:hypothetical protein
MPSKTPSERSASLRIGVAAVLLAAIVAGASGVNPAAAAAPDQRAAGAAHPAHGHDAVPRRRPRAATLPHGPEYGFLKHIPPNAIRMPGYIFVPGVGILGESCDLPSSACSNRYRDIQ